MKNKKFNLIILFTILIFLILSFYFYVKAYEESKITKTIIIDPGHGYPDGGAESKNPEQLLESDINLAISLKLKELLEKNSFTVILTRNDKYGIYDKELENSSIGTKKISDMKNRVKISKENDADMFISIHMNKLPETKCYGWQTFYKNNSKSKKIASYIQSSLNYNIKIPNNRKIKSISNIYLSKNVSIPFILIECGFLSNEKEASLLNNSSYQDMLAWSIYYGINNYYKDI